MHVRWLSDLFPLKKRYKLLKRHMDFIYEGYRLLSKFIDRDPWEFTHTRLYWNILNYFYHDFWVTDIKWLVNHVMLVLFQLVLIWLYHWKRFFKALMFYYGIFWSFYSISKYTEKKKKWSRNINSKSNMRFKHVKINLLKHLTFISKY